MKKHTILFLLCINFGISSAQNDAVFNQKNIEKQVQGLSIKKQQKAIDSLGKFYQKSDPANAVKFYDFAIKFAKINDFEPKYLAGFLLRRAQLLRKESRFALAINDLLKAEDIYLSMNNLAGL